MRKKALLVSILSFFISNVSAQQDTGGLLGDPPEGGISEWISEGLERPWEFISEALMMPTGEPATSWMMWLGGMGLLIYGLKLGVENFDNALGNWLPNQRRDSWIFGVLLSLIFIGGTNFMGWITDIVWILVIGVALFIIGMFIRVTWFGLSFAGGSAMWAGGEARQGTIGQYGGAAINQIANTVGGYIGSAWNTYQNVPKCTNGHLCPNQNPGENCWTGCGGNVT